MINITVSQKRYIKLKCTNFIKTDLLPTRVFLFLVILLPKYGFPIPQSNKNKHLVDKEMSDIEICSVEQVISEDVKCRVEHYILTIMYPSS